MSPAICGPAWGQRSPETRIPVFVSILPQAYFVERVGGDLVDVEVLVGSGHSPATYEPTPRQMVRLSNARLFFTSGVPFEKHLISRIGVTVGNISVVDINGTPIELGGLGEPAGDSSHDHGIHGHGDLDPHIWLDPNLVKLHAVSICGVLASADPEHSEFYEQNLMAFQADLDTLDRRISERLAPFRGRSFYVFHPAFGHFAKAYGLHQVAIEEDGKEPSARRLADLIDQADRDNVRVIIVQEQFSTSQAEAIAEAVGARIVKLDPLARDYLANMESIADALAGAFAE
jgi:zinc transport system substrate-binding protein